MNKHLAQLIIIQFKQFIREPAVIFWGIGFPVLMTIGLGLAFTQKKDMERNISIVHTEQGRTSKINSFLKNETKISCINSDQCRYKKIINNEKLGRTTFYFNKSSWDEAIIQLKRGSISVILSEKNNNIDYHFDPVNPEAQLIHLQLSSLLNHRNYNFDSNTIKPLSLIGTRYIDFLIPGLVAMGVMMSIMWGISYTLIDRRSKKLLRRMIATPMKKSYFLIAIFVGRFSLNIIESAILIIFAHFALGITIQGSIPALIMIYIAGNISFTCFAIFVSSRTSNTEVGNGLINIIVTPMMFLSGIFFSYHNFPEWSMPILQKLPLSILADGIRAIFIEGASVAAVIYPSALLLIIGIPFFVVGLKVYKWY